MPTRAEIRRAAEAAAIAEADETSGDEDASNESAESKQHRGYVRYVGISHVRQITQEDLQKAGFSGASLVDLVWERSNSFTVPRSNIPDDVYERAIVPDMELVLVDGGGQRL